MNYIVLENVKPYDGRYELELSGDQFTTREWGWIKRFAGYLPANLEEGLRGFDPELICAYATIALYRAGKIDTRDVAQVFDRIADAPFGSTIRLDADTADQESEEEDANPPPSPPSSSGNGSTSGPGSTPSSETSAVTPDRSGILASGSSGSVPERWAT